MKKNGNKKLYMGCSFLGVFILWTILVMTGAISSFDEAIGTVFPRVDWLTDFMKFITYFGEGITLIVIGIMVSIFIKEKKYGVMLFVDLAGIASINSLLKIIFRRSRPSIGHLIVESGFSYPSGHSSSSMAFYGYLIYLVNKKCKNTIVKRVLTVLLSILVITIGISRIYLGVHYPSDVVGAFIYALGYLILYVLFTGTLGERSKEKVYVDK